MNKMLCFSRGWFSLWCIQPQQSQEADLVLPFQAMDLPGQPTVYLQMNRPTFEQLFPKWDRPAVSVLRFDLTIPWDAPNAGRKKARRGR